MRKIHYGIIVLMVLAFCSVKPVSAQISIGIGLPHVSIGINLPLYPELVPVPGYPVYYAPQVAANYFFYDGLYWVFRDSDWYASEWYNGPWWLVEPEVVPLYILRVPVRYYRHPPPSFRRWQPNSPPRWGQYWGSEWEQHRKGWNKWDRRRIPTRAPLPVYQRNYSGDRYPRQVEEQQALRREHYRYQPRTRAVRQHFQPQGEPAVPTPSRKGRSVEPRMSAPGQKGGPPYQPYQPPPRRQGPEYREQRELPREMRRERSTPAPQERERIMRQERALRETGQGREQRPAKGEERRKSRED